MSLTEDKIKQLIVDKKAGKYESHYGPSVIAGKEVWEIWVVQNGNYNVHFIVDELNKNVRYFESFQTFCTYFENESGNLLIIRVAAFTFVLTVSVFLYLLIKNSCDANILNILAGIIAAGVAMFFRAVRR